MKTTTTPSCDTNQPLAQNATSGQIPNRENDGDELPESVDFVPTRFEVELLARHWLNTHLEIDLLYFLDGQTGSTESGLDRLAEERMDEIREALGEVHFQEFAADVGWDLGQALSLRPPASRPAQRVGKVRPLEFPDDRNRLGFAFDKKTRVCTGYVDEVNGAGGALTAGFVPTFFELAIITRHWLFTHLDTAYYCYVVNQTGSTEWRLIYYSDQRLAKLRKALGDERYLTVCAEVDAEFVQRLGQEAWQSFRIPEK